VKPHTALIVCGGGFQGLSLIKALREVAGTRVLVLDTFEENVARYFADACFLAPPLSDADRFLEYALRLCQQEAVDTVFAATNHELDLLSRHRAAFTALGTVVQVSASTVLALAADKLKLYGWLTDEGLSCLPFFENILDPAATPPFIGKRRDGWGGRNVQVVNSIAEARSFSDPGKGAFVWQPLLPEFDEYSIDCAVDQRGRISPLYCRRRIRTLGGFAILGQTGAPDHVLNLANSCLNRLAALGALGPLNLQILRQGDASWVSDLNARVGTSMPLSLVADGNPIEFLLNGVSGSALGSAAGPRARSLRYLSERYVPDLQLDLVRGVVFDLDDTLLDQKAWILAKLELTWQSATDRLPAHDHFMALALHIIEEGNRSHLFDALAKELGWESLTRTSMIESYRMALPESAPVYPDVLATLTQLRRLGYKLGLLTDNPVASQQQKLEVCGLGPLFDALLFTSALGANKPDPKGFHACSEALGMSAGSLVMVGDNLFRDILGSQSAGFRHGFLVRRKGSFFNFNPALARYAGLDLRQCTPVDELSELFAHLRGVSPGASAPESDTIVD